MSLDSFEYICIFLIGISFMMIFIIIYDGVYIIPVVDEKANKHCQEQGFDFYEDYSRVGFLSKEPVAIICKYVEQYRDIDLNINEVGK